MTEFGVKKCATCACKIDESKPYFQRLDADGEHTSYKCVKCDVLDQYLEFTRTGIVTTTLLFEATNGQFYNEELRDKGRYPIPILQDPEQYRPICDANKRLHERTKDFERDRWFNGGLRMFVRSQTAGVLVGETDDMDVRLMSLAGRCVITLEDKASNQSITVITAEDEEPFARRGFGSDSMGPMGIQGVYCSVEVGLGLLNKAIKQWPTDMKPDTVVYAGMRIS
jgi:hypothetical protein